MPSKLGERVKELEVKNDELAVKLAKAVNEQDTLRKLNTVFAERLNQARTTLATLKTDCDSASHNEIKLLEAETAEQMGKLIDQIKAFQSQVALQQDALEKLRKDSATRQNELEAALALAEARGVSAEAEVLSLRKVSDVEALLKRVVQAHVDSADVTRAEAHVELQAATEKFNTSTTEWVTDMANEYAECKMQEAQARVKVAHEKFKESVMVCNHHQSITNEGVKQICTNAKATLLKDLATLLQCGDTPVSPTIDQPLTSDKTFADCVR
jgi:hypothetical protein